MLMANGPEIHGKRTTGLVVGGQRWQSTRPNTTAGPSTPLRFAQDDTFWVNGGQRTTATAKTTAGPSTPLRFAQDDTF